MNKSYIDLHIHSLYSDDGEFTPTQLVEMCYEAGVKIMAIADHNWVKAIDEAKKKAGERHWRFSRQCLFTAARSASCRKDLRVLEIDAFFEVPRTV